MKKLKVDWNVRVRNYIDLSVLARMVDPFWNEEFPGGNAIALIRLVARYQRTRLDKKWQLSDWAAPLNEQQVECNIFFTSITDNMC